MYFKRYVALSFVFIAVLLIIRIFIANTLHYAFLFWNLLLAYIPVAISSWALKNKTWQKWTITKLMLFGSWLVFLPNAPYVITDFLHLKTMVPIPMYYDTILLFMCAFTGIVFYIVAVMQMEQLWRKHFNTKLFWFYGAAFVLTSFGIYLGRYLRFNSWELLTNPLSLLYEIVHRVIYPLQHPRTWAVTALFSVSLLLIYKMVMNLLQVVGAHLAAVKEIEDSVEMN